MKNIIYILCYDDKTEEIANENFKEFVWARVYKLTNQNHLFEGKFLSVDLFELYDEWKDADFVGVLSYKAFEKIDKATTIEKIDTLQSNIYDALFLNVWNHDCLESHYQAGSHMRRIFKRMISILIPQLVHKSFLWDLTNTLRPTKYATCNYFVTRPTLMYEYIQFFRDKWLPLLESQPGVWNNALYGGGRLIRHKLLELSNGRAPHYTYHTFINERLLYPYFHSRGVSILT